MSQLDDRVSFYLDRMRQGAHEEAFFALIDTDDAALPLLMDAFRKEDDAGIRAKLVECIWQHRSPETISFLAELLLDTEPEVWKQALDGLVAIGGTQAIGALEAARAKLPESPTEHMITPEWIDEAFEQIRENQKL